LAERMQLLDAIPPPDAEARTHLPVVGA
jgi:hypothetical protein